MSNTVTDRQPKKPRGRPFPKGKSGNPGGRPRGESLTAILRRVLEEPDDENPEITRGERVARALVDYATRGGSGDATYLRELLDRCDGKVPEKIETSVKLQVVNDLL